MSLTTAPPEIEWGAVAKRIPSDAGAGVNQNLILSKKRSQCD